VGSDAPALSASAKVLRIGVRCWLFLRLKDGGDDFACLNRSSVSRRRASRASSSWVWVETACFLARSAPMLVSGEDLGRQYFWWTFLSKVSNPSSILNRSSRAAEKLRATVLCRTVRSGCPRSQKFENVRLRTSAGLPISIRIRHSSLV